MSQNPKRSTWTSSTAARTAAALSVRADKLRERSQIDPRIATPDELDRAARAVFFLEFRHAELLGLLAELRALDPGDAPIESCAREQALTVLEQLVDLGAPLEVLR